MRVTTQSGSTPIDLIAALALWGTVSALVVTTLLAGARSARRVTMQAERRETLRAASQVSAAELRGHAGGLSAIRVASNAVEYRARRWTGVTCRWPSTASGQIRLTLRAAPLFGERLPIAQRDSALVWLEGYPADPTDGRWEVLLVVDVASATCPDGRAGVGVVLERWSAVAPGTLAHPGAPVVGFERAALRVYRGSDGAHWLGLATAGPTGWKSVQPFAGPFAPSSGFAWRQDGRSVAIGLRAAGPRGDSLETIVGVRSEPEALP
jgi:hypothetical protein